MNTFLQRALLASATLFSVAAAQAAPPANIGGTTWAIEVNQENNTLVISNQGGPGAPGGATCRVILGTIGIAPIRGWYCPATGALQFVHRNIDSGVAVRVFTGSLSDTTVDGPLKMAGTVGVHNAVFGDLGTRNFSATQQ